MSKFFQKEPKKEPHKFDLKSMGFHNCPKSHQNIWATLVKNLLARNSKHRPIWLHCLVALRTKTTSFYCTKLFKVFFRVLYHTWPKRFKFSIVFLSKQLTWMLKRWNIWLQIWLWKVQEKQREREHLLGNRDRCNPNNWVHMNLKDEAKKQKWFNWNGLGKLCPPQDQV